MNPSFADRSDTDSASQREIAGLAFDGARLAAQIADCARTTADFLASGSGKPTRFRISRITLALFAVIVTVTLVLNLSLVAASANLTQLLLSNTGVLILHVLLCICIVSDLARGKTHFHSERTQLDHQLREITEHLGGLVVERQQWITAIDRCKVTVATTESQAQRLAQQVADLEDKRRATAVQLDDCQSKITETSDQRQKITTALETLTQQRSATERELVALSKSVAQAQAELVDQQQVIAAGKLTLAANASARDACADEQLLAETNATVAREELQRVTAALAEKTSELETEVSCKECVLIELQGLSDQHAALSTSLLELQSRIAAAELTSAAETESLVQLNTQIDLRRRQHEQLGCQNIELASQAAALETKIVQSEKELAQLTLQRDSLQKQTEELNCRNIELVNQALKLEIKTAQGEESLARIEAEIQALTLLQLEKRADIDAASIAALQLESRVANTLGQISDFECIATAAAASHQAERELQQQQLVAQIAQLENERDALTCTLGNIQSEMALSASVAQKATLQSESDLLIADQKRHEAEKLMNDANRRTEMLTEKSNKLADQVQLRAAELFEFKQELMSLRQEKKDLEAQRNEIQLSEQALKLQSENALAELQELTSVQQTAESALGRLREETKLQHTQIAQLHVERSALNGEMEELAQSLQLLVLERDVLTQETGTLSDLKAQSETMQQQLALASEELEHLNTQQAVAAECLNTREQAILVAESRCLELQNAMQETANLHIQCQATASLAEFDLADTLTRLEVATSKCTESELRSAELDARLATQTDQLQALIAQFESAKLQLQQLTENVADAQAVGVQWSTYLEALKQDAALQENTNAASQRNLIALRDQEAECLKQAESAQFELDKLLLERQRIDSLVNDSQRLLQQIHQAADEADAQRDNANRALDLAKDALADALRVADDAQREAAGAQRYQAEARRIKEDAQLDAADAQRGAAEARRELQIAETSLNLAIDSRAIAETQLHETLAQLDASRAEADLQAARLRELFLEQNFVHAQNTELQRRVDALESETRSLESRKHELTELDDELNAMRVNYCELSKAVENAQAEAYDLQEKVAALAAQQQDLQQLDADCQQRHSLLLGIEDSLLIRESDARRLTAEIAELEQYRNKLVELEAACRERTEILNLLNSETAIEQSRLIDTQAQHDAAQQLFATLTLQRQAAQDELAALRQQANLLQEKVTTSQQQFATGSAQESQLAAKIEQSRSELEKRRAEIAAQELLAQSTDQTLQSKQAEVRSLQEKAASAEAQAVEALHAINALGQLQDTARKALADDNLQLVELHSNIETLLQQHNQLTIEVTAASTQLASLRPLLEQTSLQRAQLQAEITALANEQSRLLSNIAADSSRLEAIQIANAAAEAEAAAQAAIEAVAAVAQAQAQAQAEAEAEAEAKAKAEAEAEAAKLVAAQLLVERDMAAHLTELEQLSSELQVRAVPSTPKMSNPRLNERNRVADIKPAVDEWESVFAQSEKRR